jgi:hypothetical protein
MTAKDAKEAEDQVYERMMREIRRVPMVPKPKEE